MARLTKVLGVREVKRALRKVFTSVTKNKRPADVLVGYTANYAIYVHENTQAHHVIGNAKFLERPARQKEKQIARIILNALKAGTDAELAMLLGGLFLQRESQLQVPVDTGVLRNSAFTRLDK